MNLSERLNIEAFYTAEDRKSVRKNADVYDEGVLILVPYDDQNFIYEKQNGKIKFLGMIDND